MRRKTPVDAGPWAIAGGPDPAFDDDTRRRHHAALTDVDLLGSDDDADAYDMIVRRHGHVWDCPRDGTANVAGYRCATCGCTRAEAAQQPCLRPRRRPRLRRAEPLAVRVREDGARHTITVSGALDVATAQQVRRVLQEAADSAAARIELDLSQLTFMDCAGMASIVETAWRLAPRLRIRPGPPRVQRTFVLLGLDERLPFTEFSEPSARVAYVRRLVEAFAAGGVEALAELVPDDVEWIPQLASGRVLRGTRELRAFFATRAAPDPMPRVAMVQPAGSHVLVRFDYATNAIWSLYVFEDDRLVRAISFSNQRDALSAA